MSEYKRNKPEASGEARFKGFVAAFMQGGGQNAALKWLSDNKAPVSIFLITGVKFDGFISAFDQYTISISDASGRQQIIYKDKISTIALKRSSPPSRRGSYQRRSVPASQSQSR